MAKRRFTLKDGTTIDEVVDVDGNVYFTSDTGVVPREFQANDGYTYRPTKTGAAVQDVDENGEPIKRGYIGGTTHQVRDKYWEKAPIMRHAVDSIANEYDISPELLRKRIDKEGFTDGIVYSINDDYLNYDKHISDADYNYSLLNSPRFADGFNYFGLDDVADMIEEGKVNPKNETWYNGKAHNEKGREVNFATGSTVADNIGLTAATLKYLREQAAKDFPNSSRRFLDDAANIYYNRGIAGGKKYLKSKKK